MNREILYRGKRKDNGEWIEGYYVCVGGKYHYILTGKLNITAGYPQFVHYSVIPETVGECTELPDKNGKQIFEGHICKVCRGVDIETGVIYYDDRVGAWGVRYNKQECNLLFDIFTNEDENVWIEVIGNIHDTPELLEEGVNNG